MLLHSPSWSDSAGRPNIDLIKLRIYSPNPGSAPYDRWLPLDIIYNNEESEVFQTSKVRMRFSLQWPLYDTCVEENVKWQIAQSGTAFLRHKVSVRAESVSTVSDGSGTRSSFDSDRESVTSITIKVIVQNNLAQHGPNVRSLKPLQAMPPGAGPVVHVYLLSHH